MVVGANFCSSHCHEKQNSFVSKEFAFVPLVHTVWGHSACQSFIRQEGSAGLLKYLSFYGDERADYIVQTEEV